MQQESDEATDDQAQSSTSNPSGTASDFDKSLATEVLAGVVALVVLTASGLAWRWFWRRAAKLKPGTWQVRTTLVVAGLLYVAFIASWISSVLRDEAWWIALIDDALIWFWGWVVAIISFPIAPAPTVGFVLLVSLTLCAYWVWKSQGKSEKTKDHNTPAESSSTDDTESPPPKAPDPQKPIPAARAKPPSEPKPSEPKPHETTWRTLKWKKINTWKPFCPKCKIEMRLQKVTGARSYMAVKTAGRPRGSEAICPKCHRHEVFPLQDGALQNAVQQEFNRNQKGA